MTGMEGGSNEWQQWEKISGGRESQVERDVIQRKDALVLAVKASANWSVCQLGIANAAGFAFFMVAKCR